jgi:chemotaxis signal transduction protein
MSDVTPQPHRSVIRLRQEFDGAFALPFASPPASIRLLLLSVGGVPAAVPLDECVAVRTIGTITTLPAAHPAFRGVAAPSGAVLPVYDMATLLGFAIDPAPPPGRWMIVAGGAARVCLVIDALEGYADVPADSVPADAVITVSDTPRRLVRLSEVVAGLARDIDARTPAQE